MEIVDSQIHLFGPDAQTQGARIGQRILSAEDVIVAMDEVGVARAYLVPVGSAANSTCLDAVQRWPDRFRVMGIIGLNKPESHAAVAGWRSNGYTGCRLGFPPFRDPSWLRDGTADWFWPIAEAEDLPVMIWAPDQLDEVERIAQRYPGLKLVVDHFDLFVDDKGSKVLEVVDRLVMLGKHPNIAVKASALPANSTEGYPYRDLHPSIQAVLDAFGADRVFWGTDLTRLPCSYMQAVTMFTEELEGLTADDLEKVMGGAVTKWIGW